jgi:hypothetical protein
MTGAQLNLLEALGRNLARPVLMMKLKPEEGEAGRARVEVEDNNCAREEEENQHSVMGEEQKKIAEGLCGELEEDAPLLVLVDTVDCECCSLYLRRDEIDDDWGAMNDCCKSAHRFGQSWNS